MTKSALALLGAASILGLSACATVEEPRAIASAEISATTAPDLLAEGFENPPNSARPRTWWHWMNGNITQEGIARDLDWMHRIGLGGFQNFDASLQTPQIVENRLVYMTPEWREAFRFAASEAARLDLEMAIAASPGWSETGGPWVAPEDGMKKLVWGATLLRDGEEFGGTFNRAPSTTGPFQDVHFEDELAGIGGAESAVPPEASGHVAVLAFPLTASSLVAPRFSLADGSEVDGAVIIDGDLATSYALPLADDLSGTLSITYPNEVTVRSLQLSIPGLVMPFRSTPILPVLEARVDGAWLEVAQLPLANIPSTFGFDSVTAREFRIRIAANEDTTSSTELAGVEGAMSFDIFATGELDTLAIADLRLSDGHRMNRVEEKAGYASV
ncbi:MAG: glycosyl hydrolase, partial [Novosphingobium sp.]|nr:glycosyl hydrolase [Novosphingobium sp.]